MDMKQSYSLTATNSQKQTNTTVNTTNPEDLLRLLQLSGQDADSFSLNATVYGSEQTGNSSVSNSQSVSMQTTNPDDVVRLLQLSGMETAPDTQVDKDSNSHACGCGETCSCGGNCGPSCACQTGHVADIPVMEQQAEYDYGHRDSEHDQDTFDIKDYNWKGRADLPERLTNARYGSNAMVSDMRESIHQKLVTAYKEFLEEGEIDTASGLASPLTSNSRNEFNKDPFAEEEPDTDGSESPLTHIKRQHIPR